MVLLLFLLLIITALPPSDGSKVAVSSLRQQSHFAAYWFNESEISLKKNILPTRDDGSSYCTFESIPILTTGNRRKRKKSDGSSTTSSQLDSSGCIGTLSMYHVPKTRDISVCHLLPTIRNAHIFLHSKTGASNSLGIGLKNGTPIAKQWISAGFDSNGRTRLRWEIPLDHPGQDRNRCIEYSLAASRHGFYPAFYNDIDKATGIPWRSQRGFYVLYMQRAAVHPTGHVFMNCGYFFGEEGCETRRKRPAQKWWLQASMRLEADFFKEFNHLKSNCSYGYPVKRKGISLPLSGTTATGNGCFRYFEKVFVITALWDDNYHHFLIDSLSRLARALPFLLDNSDIMIHIRAYEHTHVHHLSGINASEEAQVRSFISEAVFMRNRIFSLLGIAPSRIISGFDRISLGKEQSGDLVLAGQVYIPRPIRCAFALSNAEEVRLLARILLTNAFKKSGISFNADSHAAGRASIRGAKKRLIILQRYTDSPALRREWDNETFNQVIASFSRKFRDHEVFPMRSNDGKYRSCFDCEIREFSKADVLVGMHGAGLTNMIFMPKNSLVVEFTGEWDSRMMPVCGYTGPLCAANGHHHYIHHYDWDGLDGHVNNTMNLRAINPDEAAENSYNMYHVIQKKNS